MNADPSGLLPSSLSAQGPSLSIPALGAFQLQLTPFNSTPTFARMERPSDALFFSEGMLFARPDARAMANAKARDAARDAGAEFPVDVDDVCAADVDGGGGGDALDAGCGVDLLSRRTAEATTAYARAFLEILDARVGGEGANASGADYSGADSGANSAGNFALVTSDHRNADPSGAPLPEVAALRKEVETLRATVAALRAEIDNDARDGKKDASSSVSDAALEEASNSALRARSRDAASEAASVRRWVVSLTLVPIRPRRRGERRSLRTLLPGVSLRPPPFAGFNPDAHTSTPFNSASDAFQLHPDIRRFVRTLDPKTTPGVDPRGRGGGAGRARRVATREGPRGGCLREVVRTGVGRARREGGAFYPFTLVPIRPRSRGERRSLRTSPGDSLRPPHGFNPRPRCL